MLTMMPFAASLLAKVTIVMLLALAGARMGRRNRAAVRHVLLAAGFAAVLLLPIVSVAAPAIRLVIPAAAARSGSGATNAAYETIVASMAPFAETGTDVAGTPQPSPWPSWPVLAGGVWALGTTLFLLPVFAGLAQVRSLRRSARPWPHGQAVAGTLAGGAPARSVDVRLHDALPGPMTCGVIHPAIVLPFDAEQWSHEDQRRAIVHEMEHVRRGDWLSHCLARVACAIYWFHPLAWIALRQLVLEAERACDDAVLHRAEATAYADQLIVLAGRLSSRTGPAVLAMANRHDLASRVRAVLDARQRRGRAGTLWIGCAVSAAALVVTAIAPVRLVSAVAAQPSQTASDSRRFDVISIKPCENEPPTPPGQRSSQGGFPNASPGSFTIECGTVERLIGTAYVRYDEPLTNQAARIGDVEWLKGLPGWVRTDKFTIEAKAEGAPDAKVMLGPMLRNLLEDRFKLKIRRATDERPMYVMTVAKGGLKIAPESCTERDPANPPTREELLALRNGGKPMCGNMNMTSGDGGTHRWVIGGQTMTGFAGTLSTFMDHHVENRTGVDGSFNIRLEFALDEHVPGPDKRYGPPTEVPESSGPNILRALEQQLGLTLELTKGPHGFLVIEHIERPSPNSGPAIARGR
jgi:uncharacterized protein (TIGR03435 family)